MVNMEGQGTVIFSGTGGEHRALTGVYYIPQLKNNIVSVGQLDENGAKVEIKDSTLWIWDRSQKLLARIERGCNRLYVMLLDITQPLCLAARRDDVAWRWHERFGHIHFDALWQLAKKDMVHGLPAIEHADQFYNTRVITKQRRLPFPAQAKYHAEHALDLVHGNICGPISPATPGGRKYFLPMVDDYNRFMWLMLLVAKSDAPAAIKRFQAVELESGRKLKILRTDYGGEFTSVEFGDYCASEGIQRHHSAPYSPQQNGVVERRNQTIVATTRSLLKQRDMPAMFWGEAVSTAVFLLNRAPTKALDGKTLYEAYWDWSKEEEEVRSPGESVIESTTMTYGAPAAMSPDHGGADFGPGTPPATPPPVLPSPAAIPPSSPAPAPVVEFASPPADAEESLDAEHDDTPVRFRRVDNILGDDGPLPDLAVCEMAEAELHMLSTQEPATFAEAEKKIEWQRATEEEIHAVEEDMAPRRAPAWTMSNWTPLDASLLQLGFKWCASEHGVYTRGNGDQRLLIGIYVDDLIITSGNSKEIEKFKVEMKAKFRMIDLELLSFYLGIEVKQRKEEISLSQSAYAAKIVAAGGMQVCNPCLVPMEPRFKLSKVSSAPVMDATAYKSIVGSLRYLTHTHPDIAFAVGYVSRFMEALTTKHFAAVKRILRYLVGTLSHGLCYKQGGMKNAKLVGYSDSDMAGDIDTHKSTNGGIFFLSGCPISWYSLKQRVVALSSCEAEYIAAISAACQGIWLARLLGELQGREADPFELKMDNKAAIELSKSPVFHERSKHIDTRYHFIRDCVEQRKTWVNYISTKDQVADILTKPLGRIQFQELRSRIGMIEA
ncbi:hypothetical protein QOZ80_7BG0599500 [Eleusine coracana subsp. coracana]|nr:hypothetical protein QOZ80_7BG0599500 [Eleusine coracana subsp. coracana]